VPFVVEKLRFTFSTILHATYRRLFRQKRDRAGNMIGVPNPPATATGSTPAWNQFTERQWNAMTLS